MNRKVYLIALGLIVTACILMAAKVIYGGQTMGAMQSRSLWHTDIVMSIAGQGTRAKIRLTLPHDSDRQVVYNENFETDELVFYVRERPLTGNRIGFWRSELLDGGRSLRYSFSVQLSPKTYKIPEDIEIPQDPAAAYPPEFAVWLDPSELIQSDTRPIRNQLKKIIGREKKSAKVLRRIYDFVRGEVKYQSERGSKTAAEALKQLTADCGGQARLFVAFARAAKLPARTVGGIILKEGIKNITHVWAEVYVSGEWIPFDASNGHYAALPEDYLVLYRGDYALFKHTGLSKFEYFFAITPERMPPVDNPWSLYILPLHFQNFIKILLLIPVGALVVALSRTIIGVPTFGTFGPVLLALAFSETSLGIGLFCLTIVVFLGWLVRRMLDHLKILVIPRLSIIVTMVVILVLIILVVSFHLGQQKVLYFSFFPMIIMTWIVERFSVLQIEDGTPAAFKSAAGTAAVSMVAYYFMGMDKLRIYLFAFPELLLVVMAILLLLGRYTGIRLTEFWRFKEYWRARREKGLP